MTVTDGMGERNVPVAAATRPWRPEASVFDRARTLERLCGNEALLARIAVMFLRDGPRLLSDILDAIGRSEMEVLLRNIHTLKGAVSNFSAEAAFRAAADMEEAARNGGPPAAARAWGELNERIDRLCQALRVMAEEGTP